ncbi:MAG: hypothetical protein Q7T16_03660 [Candidatus Burarchaeum sp.]|nr:hypothetical protein [Candidatus Burarchaeum sp.]MDO8339728.1 hypothetical protein [Candidatus Burarchaeum sp.]
MQLVPANGPKPPTRGELRMESIKPGFAHVPVLTAPIISMYGVEGIGAYGLHPADIFERPARSGTIDFELGSCIVLQFPNNDYRYFLLPGVKGEFPYARDKAGIVTLKGPDSDKVLDVVWTRNFFEKFLSEFRGFYPNLATKTINTVLGLLSNLGGDALKAAFRELIIDPQEPFKNMPKGPLGPFEVGPESQIKCGHSPDDPQVGVIMDAIFTLPAGLQITPNSKIDIVLKENKYAQSFYSQNNQQVPAVRVCFDINHD